MHHTNPGQNRLRWAHEVHELATQPYLAAVARQKTVEDVHQRRLAGAVLADEGMNLAGMDPQRRVMDGDKSVEALRDMRHVDDVAASVHRCLLARRGPA